VFVDLTPSQFLRQDHLKGQLSLLISHNFLDVFNHKSHLRVYCLYMYVCVCVCVYENLY